MYFILKIIANCIAFIIETSGSFAYWFYGLTPSNPVIMKRVTIGILILLFIFDKKVLSSGYKYYKNYAILAGRYINGRISAKTLNFEIGSAIAADYIDDGGLINDLINELPIRGITLLRKNNLLINLSDWVYVEVKKWTYIMTRICLFSFVSVWFVYGNII